MSYLALIYFDDNVIIRQQRAIMGRSHTVKEAFFQLTSVKGPMLIIEDFPYI